MRGVRGIAASVAGLVLIVVAGIFAWQVLPLPADQAATQVGLVVGILAVLGTLWKGLEWLWRKSNPREVGRPSAQEVDDLAGTVYKQWEEEATWRSLLAPAPLPIRWTLAAPELQGPIDGAVGLPGQPRRYNMLPGLDEVTGQLLRSGGGRPELHRAYGGLPSGRLVITGDPGAGKTSAGIMLLLDALAFRDRLSTNERSRVPVPVMFTMADWDPNATPFEDWLEGELAADYYPGPGGRKQAKALIDNSQVAAIVDGLDEIEADLRPIALEAMSAARLRLVLLTRTEEMAIAAREHRLVDAAVLELCPVKASAAADYLQRSLPGRPPAHWDHLLSHLRSKPEGHLARSLRTPLALTLVRDTYRAGDNIEDLLNLSNTSEPWAIEEHLLDRTVTAAYARRPGERRPAYKVDVAERTLSFIAERMSRDNTRDLAWWRVDRWSPREPRSFTRFLLVVVLPIGLTNIFIDPPLAETITGFAIVVLLLSWLVHRLRGRGPHRAGGLRIRSMAFLRAIVIGGVVLAMMLILLPPTHTPLRIGFALGCALAVVLVIARTQPETDIKAPVTPTALWRGDQQAALLAGFVFAFPLGLAAGLWLVQLIFVSVGWTVTAAYVMAGGMVLGLVAGLVSAVLSWTWSVTVTTSLAFAQLAIAHRVPMRLLHFFEDARRRGVFRTVGPVYQFRHARLQDRLAIKASARSSRITGLKQG